MTISKERLTFDKEGSYKLTPLSHVQLLLCVNNNYYIF